MTAFQLREKVKAEAVRVRDVTGEREASVAQVLKEAGGRVSLLEILRRLGETGVVDLAGLLTPPRPPVVERLLEAPRVETFVGRQRELEIVTGKADRPRLLVVRGVAGIGKSALAARACELLRGSRNLFWHRIRSWDTSRSILADLGEFLSLLGRPGVLAVLGRGEATKAPQVLRQDLPGTGSYIVFDDAQEANSEVLSLLRFLKDVLADAPDVHVLVLTRRRIPFYDRRDVVLHRMVGEIDLQELESEDVIAFLAGERERVATAEVHRGFGGHPLFLQLVRSSPKASVVSEARRDLRRFLEETVYGELSDAERRMMKVACLYRVPVPREAFFADPALSHDVLVSLADRALLIPVGQENFEVHDTIQEFFATVLTDDERRELSTFAVRTLTRLASKASSNGDLISCIGYLSNAIQLASSPQERVGALEALGDAHERLGDLPGTIVAYKEALKAAQDSEVIGRLHRKTASAFQIRGETSSASGEVEAALRALRDRLSVEHGWLDLVLCRVRVQLEEWEEAGQYGEAALQIFRQLSVPAGQAQAFYELGNMQINSPKGDPKLAERYLAAALELSGQTADPQFMISVRIALAHLLAFRRGDVDGAMEHLAAVEALPKAGDDPHLRRRLATLRGWISLELRADYAAAITYFGDALSLARKIHNAHSVLIARYGLALVSYFQGDLYEARQSFEWCAAELRAQGFLGIAVEAMSMAAECCLLQEDILGFHHIVAAFDDPELSRGVEARIVFVKVLRALDALLKGDREDCRTTFEEALRLAQQEFAVQDWPLLYFGHFFYGVALGAMGQDRLAARHVHEAHEFLRAHGLQARLSAMVSHERQLTEILRRSSKGPYGGVWVPDG